MKHQIRYREDKNKYGQYRYVARCTCGQWNFQSRSSWYTEKDRMWEQFNLHRHTHRQ